VPSKYDCEAAREEPGTVTSHGPIKAVATGNAGMRHRSPASARAGVVAAAEQLDILTASRSAGDRIQVFQSAVY
jgi:hypothetical protein